MNTIRPQVRRIVVYVGLYLKTADIFGDFCPWHETEASAEN